MSRLFDCHFHVIDYDFPLVSNQGYMPESYTVSDYLSKLGSYELVGGAVVSGSFHAFDQSYLIAALKQLGSNYVGVAQLPIGSSDKQILSLHAAGVRAVRFNLRRECVDDLKVIDRFSRHVHALCGWHSEFYVDSEALISLENTLRALPKIVIDHLGLERGSYSALCRLVEDGASVKATGFGRLDFDAIPVMRRLYEINPHSIMFGSDLPSTRAPVPFSEADILLIDSAFDYEAMQRLMWQNALSLYRPRNLI